ncbi:unnamed protein product [Bursaphelenchus xylophilus]|uniref:(pine wood nematode) hypothetical protein n=1 Tax=Bursaphelenchus xylophilus TaxID=6326 RepID=A0A1I7RH95_BURXY|nr:unnamed protein product [Bursaphelenchus xylophilus]CAG9115916.1 unnamed protein product [Bursaphelenchus xylophilus]
MRLFIVVPILPLLWAQNSFLEPNALPGPGVNFQDQRQTGGTNNVSPYDPLRNFNSINNNANGISVQVELKDYTNNRHALDDDRTCQCSSGECLLVSPQGMGFRCLFTFMVIVTSADETVHYRSTDFLPLNSFGQIDANYSAAFRGKFDFLLTNEPKAINVFVYNLGPVINTMSRKLEKANTLYQVDTFTIPVKTSDSLDGQRQESVVGKLLGTQLTIGYSVSCRNNLYGSGCDLQCNKSTANSGSAICHNVQTGFFSVCRWQGPKQVYDCKNCPWGIKENAYCMDERGGVLESDHVGVVSEDFRTATIILGVITGLLLILLLAFVILYCCAKRSGSSRGYRGSDRDDIRPLNTADSTALTPVITPKNSRGQIIQNKPYTKWPEPKPRPGYPVPSHLSGGVNNSLNSSFSSVAPPIVPSRSADV